LQDVQDGQDFFDSRIIPLILNILQSCSMTPAARRGEPGGLEER
jgi:hypothetical protein